MDPPADQHQHGQLSNRKNKKGSQEEEGKPRKKPLTPGEELKRDLKLWLAELCVYIRRELTREVVFRIVLFFTIYFTLTRFNVIVTFLFNIFKNE